MVSLCLLPPSGETFTVPKLIHSAPNSNVWWQLADLSSAERGFVAVKSTQKQNITAELQENVELRVEIEAYPPPQIRWKKDGAPVRGDKTIIIRQEHEIRWDILPGPGADLPPFKFSSYRRTCSQ